MRWDSIKVFRGYNIKFVAALVSMDFQKITAGLSPLDDYGFPSKQTNRGSQ